MKPGEDATELRLPPVREFRNALHKQGWAAERAWQYSPNHQGLVAALGAAVNRCGWDVEALATHVAKGLGTYPPSNASEVLLSRLRRAAGKTDQEEGA
jgi:hypothetical protein